MYALSEKSGKKRAGERKEKEDIAAGHDESH
jgi:hypothetical protein